MVSAKLVIALALLAVSINCMSREFHLSVNEQNIIQDLANSTEYIKKEDLKGLFVDVIIRTMANYNWTSDNFPSMFADEVVNNILGREVEIQGSQLVNFVKENRFTTIYKKFFKQIVSYLAKELDQDSSDLEVNFENYSLSFDTYYILTYQIPIPVKH